MSGKDAMGIENNASAAEMPDVAIVVTMCSNQ